MPAKIAWLLTGRSLEPAASVSFGEDTGTAWRQDGKVWLFHLDEDPTERVDLSAQAPDKVRELQAGLAAQEAEMVKPAWPSLIEAAMDIDHPLGVPERTDDEHVYWEN